MAAPPRVSMESVDPGRNGVTRDPIAIEASEPTAIGTTPRINITPPVKHATWRDTRYQTARVGPRCMGLFLMSVFADPMSGKTCIVTSSGAEEFSAAAVVAEDRSMCFCLEMHPRTIANREEVGRVRSLTTGALWFQQAVDGDTHGSANL